MHHFFFAGLVDGDHAEGGDAEDAFDEFGAEGAFEVLFVGDGPDGDAGGVFADDVEDFFGGDDVVEGAVGDDEDDVAAAEVDGPEAAEAFLAGEVPEDDLVGAVAGGFDLFDAEGDGGDVFGGWGAAFEEAEEGGFADAAFADEADFEFAHDVVVDEVFDGLGVVVGGDVFDVFGAVFADEHAEGGFHLFVDAAVVVLHVADEDEEEVFDVGEDEFGALDVDGEGGDVGALDVAHEFFVGAEEFADHVVVEGDAPVLFAEDDVGLESDFVFAGADVEKDSIMNNCPLTTG